jgi:hypothetical protein
MELLSYQTTNILTRTRDSPYTCLYHSVGAFVHDSSDVHCSEVCDGILCGEGNFVIKS